MKTESINKLIGLNSKMTSLLNELLESVKYEDCKYHLVCTDQQFKMFALFRIEDEKELVAGTLSRIKSYINLRNIEAKSIYNFQQ